MKGKMDWIIKLYANNVVCSCCGRVTNNFPELMCDAHTYGMYKYGHKEFQMVLHMQESEICYVLNSLGLRVQAGSIFQAGDIITDLYEDCSVRLDEQDIDGKKVLRVVIPDENNHFPEEKECMYPYNQQLLPTVALYKKEVDGL